jgi:thiol-disulfide isomerase/thioredoxin
MFRANQLGRSRRGIFCAAVFSLLLFVAGEACPHASLPESTLPERTLAEDLDGKPVDAFALSHGRVVVLLFVRTDCPISNRYAPRLQKLSEKYRGKADFWLVYPDREQTASEIRAHLEDFHYSIPALRDTRHALVRRAEAMITPEAAVFDSSGRLLYHGRIDNWYEDVGRSRARATTHELEDAISAALLGQTVTPDHAAAVGCYISDLK